MCGFVGIYHKYNQEIPLNWIHSMNDSIAHRGPDDSHIKHFGSAALGHRRLSVIDIQGGTQPMVDHRNKSWIVFNGEIYNYKYLRNQLIRKDIQFRTNSDTEVLVNYISHYGVSRINELNGMFAFSYYNPDTKYCLIARDHLGIKPVYYYENDEYLVFASEIKALLKLPFINFEVEDSLLEELLTFRFIAGSHTIFSNISQLEPGECIEIKNGRIERSKYWDLPSSEIFTSSYSLGDVAQDLDIKLEKIIQKQLISDVPVGTFLSGGVDSGIVTALTSKYKNDKLKTFVVGFDEADYDERKYAQEASQRFLTDHYEYLMNENNFYEKVNKLTYYNDEPISHPNTIPLYYLSELARSHVTVILTGEGADEMTSGYPRHQIIALREKIQFLPNTLQHKLGVFLSFLPNRKLKLLGQGFRFNSDEDAIIFNSQFVDNNLVNKLLHTDVPRENMLYRRKSANHLSSNKLHQRLMIHDIKTYLVSALHRMDRMSMAHGLECRVPFLDYELVEWMMMLDPRYKIHGKTNKYILKKVAESHLNQDTIYRPKSGFGLPLAQWFRDDKILKPFLLEISINNYNLNEYFDGKLMSKLVSDHLTMKNDHSELFWILLCLHNWYDVFSNYK